VGHCDRAIARIFSLPGEANFSLKGRSPKPTGPRAELWFLPPSHQLKGLGECCKLPGGVRGRAYALSAKRISRILSVHSGLSRQISVDYCFTQATFAETRAMKNNRGCLNGRYGTVWSLAEKSIRSPPQRRLRFHQCYFFCQQDDAKKNYSTNLHKICWKGNTWGWKKPLDVCGYLDHVNLGFGLMLGLGHSVNNRTVVHGCHAFIVCTNLHYAFWVTVHL